MFQVTIRKSVLPWLIAAASSGLAIIGIGIALLVVVGIRGCPRSQIPTAAGVRTMPGLPLIPGYTVRAIDFFIQDDRIAHVVWRLGTDDQLQVDQVWYRRLDLASNTWNEPKLLVASNAGDPRIVSTRAGLHIIVAGALWHFWSTDAGSTWIELDTLIPEELYPYAREWDVTTVGDTIVMALYVSDRRGWGGYTLGPPSLYTVNWSPAGFGSVRLLRSFDARTTTSLTPRLWSDGQRLQVFASWNRMFPDSYQTPQGGTKSEFLGGILTWHRNSVEAPWTEADSMEWPHEVYQPPNGSTVYSYEATMDGHDRMLFAGNWTLHSSRWVPGSGWASSYTVAEVPERLFSASRRTGKIVVAARSGGGQIVWVDNRFGRTNRTPLLPLGGIPWSDSPDWHNNDVFALPIRKVLSGGVGASKLRPTRLTQDLSLTTGVQAHATSRHVYVFWGGWSKIGRGGRKTWSPVTIQWARLPLD